MHIETIAERGDETTVRTFRTCMILQVHWMYERKVDECPPCLEAIGPAVEETAEWKQDERDEVNWVRQAFQCYPSIIEVLRKSVAQAG